jgi:chemotaxis response regulator CheB
MSELTELIKEAAKRKKKKQLSALKKHYRTAINWIKKHPGKATGLGALGAGAGYGGYEAIKHLLNREKKSSLFDENVVDKIADEIVKEAKATKTIAKAVKKLKKRKAAPTLAKTYKNTISWIKKNPGKATGLGVLGLGAGYGGYEAINHLLGKEKESSILDELSGEIIKEAAKRKKKKQLSALKKHYRIIKNWIKKHPGKATGLGALGVGAGYGGYEAIKHLLNREKKSSLLDEIIADELVNEIVKQAAEDEIYDELLSDSDEDVLDEDEDEIIDYLADLDDEDEDEDEDFDEEELD